MGTFQLLNFGCRASQADGAAMKQQLVIAGFEEVERTEDCEIAVLNTCTVTSTADAEVRQIIRRIHRTNPECQILVTGCYAQRAAREIADLSGVAWVVGNSHKHLIAEVLTRRQDSGVSIQKSAQQKEEVRNRISGAGPSPQWVQIEPDFRKAGGHLNAAKEGLVPLPPIREPNPESRATVLVGEIAEEFHFAPVFPDDATRPTLKVQDGCDARCSFCIIPDVRGPSRSLEPDIVFAQVRELEQKGYKEIVLSGINLGTYGKDLGHRASFQGLVEGILTKTSIPRIRISSIEPMDVTPELIRLVAEEPRMARHLHVPLQSGCDRILRAMNRRYWTSHYAEKVWSIHEQIPNCGIGADVMVGFPGETIGEHLTSLRFIESLPYTYLHVFPYSSRPGTPAGARTDHLNGRIIHERGQEIRAAIASKRAAFLQAQIGRELSAVVLSDQEGDARAALSTNYLRLLLPETEAVPNTLVDVKIGRLYEGALFGYVEASPTLSETIGDHR